MKKTIFITLLMVIGLSSCVKNSSEYKALVAQRDSLATVNARNTMEMDEILSLLNEVESNFQEIKTAENYLSTQSTAPGELTPSIRERVKSNMQFITETLNSNRQKIEELEKKLKSSSVQSAQMQQTLSNLKKQLDEKTEAVAILQDELQRKNYEISKLSENVATLNKSVSDLESQSQEQVNTIKQQWKELNTAYFCFGTSKELKEQKILAGGSLGTDFNKDYFTEIPDISRFVTLSLFAKGAKMVSKHPEGSYEFIKDANGKLMLNVLDQASFWSLTKYLVIQVNV